MQVIVPLPCHPSHRPAFSHLHANLGTDRREDGRVARPSQPRRVFFIAKTAYTTPPTSHLVVGDATFPLQDSQ